MRLVVERTIDIDVCDDYHGVWLDPGELDRLSDSKDFQPRQLPTDQRSDLKCPRCSKRDFAEIQTDFGPFARCNDCGGVFVGGETLDRISKCDRETLSGNPTMNTLALSADAMSGIFELLWLFVHH